MLTISRICGSGVQSIVTAAQMIKLNEAETVVAGGMENMSQAPHVLRGMRDTYKLARPPRKGTELEKDMEDYLFTNLLDGMCGSFMAQTSDEICKRKGVTREETDEFAAMSHSRTAKSIETGIADLKESLKGTDVEDIKKHLKICDGVMIGRAIYQNPYFLSEIEKEIFNTDIIPSREDIAKEILKYLEEEVKLGTKVNHVMRHTVGLYHGPVSYTHLTLPTNREV